MPIAFFEEATDKPAISAAGAPTIIFRFSGDTCEAELEGITLAAARSLMEVGCALIWSNWRRKHAFDAAARAEEEKLGAPDGWDSPFSKRCVDADAAKLRELIADYLNMEGNSTGGSLHIVLDDGNHDRSSVAFCVRYAAEHRDWDGVALGTAILALDDIEYDTLLPPWDDEESHPDPLPGPALQPADLLAALDNPRKYAPATAGLDFGGGERPADESQKASAWEDAAREAGCCVDIGNLRDELAAINRGLLPDGKVLIEHINAALVQLYQVARRG